MKKAIFFSIITIFLITMFVVLLEISSEDKNDTELEITRVRVKLLNYQVADLENEYFEKLVYVASKNALTGLSNYYYDNDFSPYVIKLQLFKALNDSMQDGFLVNTDLSKYINPKYTVEGIKDELDSLSKSLDIEIQELMVNIIEVKQQDPWNIEITAFIKYSIKDKHNIAGWQGTSVKTVVVSVIGLYCFDQDGNTGRITSGWSEENNPLSTEPSVVDKLSGIYSEGEGSYNGVCVSGCIV